MSDPQSSHRRRGTFAEGESAPAGIPRMSTSARSPRASPTPTRYPAHEHVGTFAEGQSDPTRYPEDEHVGTYAEREEQVSHES